MSSIQICGLVIVIAFYIAYITKQVLLRKQGIKTHRLGRGEKPKKTFYIEVMLMGATFLMVPMQLVSIIGYHLFPQLIHQGWARVVGLIIGGLGVMIFIAAMRTMKDSWRAGVDATQKTKLVDEGIYKLSRNPAFVGFDLLYIGIGLAFANPMHSIMVCVAVILLHLQILEEEKFLVKVFGKQYKTYQNKVGRYF